MITHQWNTNYNDLSSFVHIQILERRHIKLKFGHNYYVSTYATFHPPSLFPKMLLSLHFKLGHLTLYNCNNISPTQMHSFVPHTISLWNSLPEEATSHSSLNSFKMSFANKIYSSDLCNYYVLTFVCISFLHNII